MRLAKRLYAISLFISLAAGNSALAAKEGGAVELQVSLSPAGSFTAKSSAVKGSAQKDGNGFDAKDISLDLTTLETGIGLRDKHMKEKYFETEKYPKALLTQASGQDGKFTGTLKIHDTPTKVSGTYTIAGAQVVASFKCKMSEFNIPKAKYMGVGADDEVEVKATVPLSGEKLAKDKTKEKKT
jgi:polyisoprenoid-binding protein YceI